MEKTEKGWKGYQTVWVMLFFGWVVSYADRTLTGPVVTWMINNKVGFLQAAANPHALGGLLGSLFFAGYMLTQFPGGYYGDKYGYRTIIIVSIFWAGITTFLTGLTGGLLVFIAARVLTGLGEGVLYSNDRSLVAKVTPPKKLGMGMGIVMGGLTVGLSAALIGTVYLINWAKPVMGLNAWKAPFLLLGLLTVIVGLILKRTIGPVKAGEPAPYGQATGSILKYSVVFLIVIMAVYFLTNSIGLSDVAIAVILTCLAFVLLLFIYQNKSAEIRPVLRNKNLILMYLLFIPILWHLWFYGFWGGAVVQDFGGGALTSALVVISFNALAGVLGFPLGGKISDSVAHKANGRRNVLIIMTALLTVLIAVFAAYVMSGQHNPVVESTILFVSGLDFFALQAVAHALTAECAPEKLRGAAFGMENLIGEIGAVLSPVISGALRDASHGWGSALILDAVLMGIGCLLVFGVSTAAQAALGKSEVA